MWIVAIGWIYVVILMAATETSFVAGVMTFLVYCMIPLSVLFYITGGKRRQARRAARAGSAPPAAQPGAALPGEGEKSVAPNAQPEPESDAQGAAAADGGGSGAN